MTPNRSNSLVHHTALLLSLASLTTAASATGLKHQTISAFDHYVALSEARMDAPLGSPQNDPPFLWVDRLPPAQRSADLVQLHNGQVVIERLNTLDNCKPIPVPGGMVHHWIGAVFIPGATLAQTHSLMGDYDHQAEYYRLQVISSKILSRDGNDFRVYFHLYEKKILTCFLETQHEVHYIIVVQTHAWSRSRSTDIRQVADWRGTEEHDLPTGLDKGFLWRMNAHWRLDQRDGGTYVECQLISLTRDIPAGFGWLIGPFVQSIPRESLEFTLDATRKALLTHFAERGK